MTDALGATRAMQPQVVRPEGSKTTSSGRELTVVHPPTSERPQTEPHLQVGNQRVRFSLSALACGTLGVTFCLLLLVSFILGMRYQGKRSRDAGALAERREPGAGQPVGEAPPGRGRRGVVDVGIPSPDPSAPTRLANATRYRLRIASTSPSEREEAEKSAATLRQSGVPVVLQILRGRRGPELVTYSEQHFARKDSSEAFALVNKVKLMTHNGRLDFASAYYVEVE